jgi:hypothetical protein
MTITYSPLSSQSGFISPGFTVSSSGSLVATNVDAGTNLTSTNITAIDIATTNLTANGSISAVDIVSDILTTTGIIATNITASGSLSVGNITASSISVGSIIATGNLSVVDTTITGRLRVTNIDTTGVLRVNGDAVVLQSTLSTLFITPTSPFDVTSASSSITTTGPITLRALSDAILISAELGNITLVSNTVGTINNMQIGIGTAAAGKFTTAQADKLYIAGQSVQALAATYAFAMMQ